MSLILDALRKLEREKDTRESGVLVVGSVPWGESSRARRIALWAGAVLVLALAVLAGWLLRRGTAATAPVEPARVAAPAPAAPSTAAPRPPVTSPPQPAPLADAPLVAPPIRLSHPPAVEGRERPASERPAAAKAAPAPDGQAEPVPSPASAVEPKPEIAPAPAAAVPHVTTPDELRLTAISQRDGKPVALINDRLVFEGDTFDGIHVIRIGDTEVEIEFKGQRRILRF
jgi:hypothetical protein